jgi:hypothetical protein
MKHVTPSLRQILAAQNLQALGPSLPGGWARQVPFVVLTLAVFGLVWFA